MISYGQLKNNLQILRKFLSKSKAFERSSLTAQHIQERNLRENNPQIFGLLLHYMLIDHSDALYEQVLNISPTIKRANDKEFFQLSFRAVKQILGLDITLTVQQFEKNRYLEAKVKFISDLSRAIWNWTQTNTPNSYPKKGITSKPSKPYNPPKEQANKYLPENNYDSDEDELWVPKRIEVTPMVLEKQVPSRLKTGQVPVQLAYEDPSAFRSDYPVKGRNNENRAPNVFPKYSQEESEQPISFQKPSKAIPKNRPKDQSEESHEQSSVDDQEKFVTRDQFNEYLSLLTTVNGTVNNLVEKFNNFQSSMLTWVNNSNAKMAIMEENIKFIKGNL